MKVRSVVAKHLFKNKFDYLATMADGEVGKKEVFAFNNYIASLKEAEAGSYLEM